MTVVRYTEGMSHLAKFGRAVPIIASDIKIAHSVFALPFALLAAFLAARPEGAEIVWSRFGGQLVLIVLAMIFARTTAMLANRLIDRKMDAENPRTAERALPGGRITSGMAVFALTLSTVGFLMICTGFGWAYGNWWPLILGGPVLGWICAYGWLKRFTWWCHLFLGSALALSPLAAALAIDPPVVMNQPSLWLLSGMVLCWVAGFDVIYALQDEEVDRRQGLFSIPARWGSSGALWWSRGLHVLSAGMLASIWILDARLNLLFGMGVICVIGLLIYEHATVAHWGTTRLALAFFTLNGIISLLLGGLGIADVIL